MKFDFLRSLFALTDNFNFFRICVVVFVFFLLFSLTAAFKLIALTIVYLFSFFFAMCFVKRRIMVQRLVTIVVIQFDMEGVLKKNNGDVD